MSLLGKNKAVLALQETYLLNDDLIKWSGNYVMSNSASTHSAGCITFLNDYVRIIEVRQLDNQGHGHVIVVDGLMSHSTIIANIYAPVRSLGREQDNFYKNLINIVDDLERKYLFNEPNLVILGDFNLPLELNRDCHNNDSELARARFISEKLVRINLTDCWKLNDDRYTYKTASSRLDRIMFRFENEYSEKLETDWTFTTSDHCLLKLKLNRARGTQSRSRVTSLPTYLLDNKEAVRLIHDKMAEMVADSMDCWEPKTKLEYLKMCLRTVVGEVTKFYNKKVNEELEEIQKNITWRMDRARWLPLFALEENNLQLDLLFTKRNLILDERNKKLAEKAKTKWFYEGEKSNKYFLNLLNKRRSVNKIEKLSMESGEVTDENEINSIINKYYKSLYERGEPVNRQTDRTFYDHIVKVQNVDSMKVTAPLTKEELYSVLITCKDSAPGPDGIPYSYYRHFWNIFGDILTQSWSDALEKGCLPDSHQVSILKLLPKVGKDPTKLTNWRPITLSNCDHKLITKCLARRLTTALKPCLHPNQTAYLPGKQIQDNLRVLNIVNERSPETLVVSLDAKKAFDSVSHSFIRDTLTEFGLSNFVPFFNLLYDGQKVKISVNDSMLEGYEIKNGVKQGDSLSCILFIMCMDPLIRNIESNTNITRAEVENTPFPRALAYADDITCIIDKNTDNLQGIFDEYERLTIASGLTLNADKTEILDISETRYNVLYGGERHILQGIKSVKINGILFHKNIEEMKRLNFDSLTEKIENMLSGWRTRRLSLLGKILIYKTFGMSQIIYVLSVIGLSHIQYKKIGQMFNNFLWGRDFQGDSTQSRISKERLNTPIEYGGFGMIPYEKVLEGIYCRQLSKMYDQSFLHPLKFIMIKQEGIFATGNSLTDLADNVARTAHNIMNKFVISYIKKLNNQQIVADVVLTNQIGATNIDKIIKPRWQNSVEATRLMFVLGCTNIRDILNCGREAIKISKKVVTATYLRVIKALWQANMQCEEVRNEKFVTPKGTYKLIYMITSKEFRELTNGNWKLLPPKITMNINTNNEHDRQTIKGYFSDVKRLVNTRHRNTLLRIWNGDCLSNTRLVHLGAADTNLCPNCAMIDTPMHMLVECQVALQVWNALTVRIPKSPQISLLEYALGIYDSRIEMSIKAEVLKMLMHFRNMNADAIYMRIKNHFLTVSSKDMRIRSIFI